MTQPNGSVLSLFLIDDHPVVSLGLSLAVQAHGGFRFIGSMPDPWQGLQAIEATRPNVLVIDLVYNGKAETGFIRECRALLPDTLIVVFSSLPQRVYEREARELGADAYVGKNMDITVLLETITQLANRERRDVIVPERSTKLIDTNVDGVYLTPREADVATRLGEGLSVLRIASDLNISPNTVSVHRDNIRKKLKCRDMTELVALLARFRDTAHEQAESAGPSHG